ncbi:putative pilin structural protein SafD [Serratia liquefaciens]|nr:putative pilin structural protein SafD [Serratia quinivorans]CAI1087029.1 putative pilin structural protein SafD [Serratia quinivorans]CAI2122235.1 putative pilin structural protein SafD [Serratia quinivorans]CAI2489284.1 putative pilin structural protein SafD [Serratia liquefaciens]
MTGGKRCHGQRLLQGITTRRVRGAALLCLWLAGSVSVSAADGPQMVLKMRPQKNGIINKDAVLGEGYVVYHNPHTGFQVWSDAVKTTDQPHRYELEGKNGSRNKLRIRLGGQDWQQDQENGKGIMLMSGDDVVKFILYSDGEQAAISDEYPVQIHGVVLLP